MLSSRKRFLEINSIPIKAQMARPPKTTLTLKSTSMSAKMTKVRLRSKYLAQTNNLPKTNQ